MKITKWRKKEKQKRREKVNKSKGNLQWEARKYAREKGQ